jgi:hypothetical protein
MEIFLEVNVCVLFTQGQGEEENYFGAKTKHSMMDL